MKNLILFFVIFPLIAFGNDKQIPSKIKEVTVYLSGAQVTRSAICNLNEGVSKVTFSELSTKIDESSIQISGLQSVSILSMEYDINYLAKKEASPESDALQNLVKIHELKIAQFRNKIAGLTEEEKVINENRRLNSSSSSIDLEQIKKISTYYRERITEIKNEVFTTNLKINELGYKVGALKKQMIELNNVPVKEKGEIKITFDTPININLDVSISYLVKDAGWIPNYDIKSKDINSPLKLSYKAHVYQKTGQDWNNTRITLSTGNPNVNIAKPNLATKYLNFTNGRTKNYNTSIQKQRYIYNPTVKQVTGIITDESGAPLPGANIVIKGSSTGTQTDFDGFFSINVANGQKLVVSYIGFKQEELSIYSSVMNVRLEEDAAILEEVVVVGYGTNKRKNYTGSVSSALSGRTSGIKVRGSSSVSSLPLYIIDGIPMTDFVEGDLDENEVQSLETLTGANATAIYGNKGSEGVVVITTKKSSMQDDITNTKFIIKKPYSIASDGDITSIEIDTFQLNSTYEYFAAPIINENVFLTASFSDWEKYNLLPGEASVYFKGSYAGKTTIDPYTVKKEMMVSLGIDASITVTRKQDKNFKSKSFLGNNRILDRKYDLEVKNNKATAVNLKLMDRIPLSQNNDIKVDDIETFNADYEDKKGLLSWKLKLDPKETETKSFSFRVKYPKSKSISL